MSSYIDKLKQALEEAKNPMITCQKCHGKGEYDVYEYDKNDMLDSISTNKCELCNGTGKITLEFYEMIQSHAREMQK